MLATLKGALSYYATVLWRALVATFTHANKQGLLLGALFSILVSFIYTKREENVALGPLLWATVIAAAIVLGVWFLVQLLATPYRMHAALQRRVEQLEAEAQSRLVYKESLSPAFSFVEDGLLVRVRNTGRTLQVRMNFIVPKPYGENLARILEDGSEAGGSLHEEFDHYRWSEFNVLLPGANTIYGFLFRVAKFTEPTEVTLALNADEFGDWIDWRETIQPPASDTPESRP